MSRRMSLTAFSADSVFSCRAGPVAPRGGRGGPEVGAVGWVTGQHPRQQTQALSGRRFSVRMCVLPHSNFTIKARIFLGREDI